MASADSAFVRVLARYFNQGDTSSKPLVDHAAPDWYVPVPAQGMGPRRVIVTTESLLFHLDGWNTISTIIINNNDDTNFIEVQWHYLTMVSADQTNVMPVAAGAPLVINGPITIANNLLLQAHGAAVSVDISIFGT